MKKFSIALFTAILIAGQFFTPVAAAAPSAWSASASCGDTYIVHRGDWLAKIASYCGTTVSDILAHNPQIFNPNWIYAGMVLRLAGSTSRPQARPAFNFQGSRFNAGFFPGQRRNIPFNNLNRFARVSLSTTRAGAGDEVTVSISGFPAKANIDFRIGRQGKDFSLVYDGITNSNGAASRTFTIPSNADSGQDWVVHVLTTELVSGVDLYSPVIHITN
jgi:LysM repeat protein